MCVSVKEKEKVLREFKKKMDEKIEGKQQTVSEEFFTTKPSTVKLEQSENLLDYILKKYEIEDLIKKKTERFLQ